MTLLAARFELSAQQERSFLIVDLEVDGFYFGDAGYPVFFDVDGDGELEALSWTATFANDAFLWVDENKNGRVDGIGELLGIVSGEESAPSTAFELLAEWDRKDEGGNDDGLLAFQDRRWGDLQLWIDFDRDGRSTRDEISRPEDWGIDEIDLDWRYELTMDGSSNFFRAATEFRSRGKGGPSKGRHPVRGRIVEVELARTRPPDREESPQEATP